MPVNEPLMRAVVDRIIDDPDSLNMANWINKTACGTVACVAGHTVLEAGLEVCGWDRVIDAGELYSIPVAAQRLLGLTKNHATRIFHGMFFCDSFKKVTTSLRCRHTLKQHSPVTPRQVIENISLVTRLDFKIPDHVQ